MRRKLLPLLSALFVLCLVPAALAGPGTGSPAPDFTLNDVNGKAHSLSDFQGKVVMLNWWASW